jgi:Flp pilus assembly protein TadD
MAPPPLNLLAQAVRLFGMGQLEPAAQACTTMARLQPNSADPLYLLGVIRDRQGRAGEAVDSFTRFVTLKRAVNPRRRCFEDHRNLGIALARLQQHDGAVESFRAALALRPDDADVHRSLGIVLATAGRFEAAVASFEKAQAIRPDAQVYSLLGDAQRQLRRYDAAIASFRQALAINPAAADATPVLRRAVGDGRSGGGDRELPERAGRQSEQCGHPLQSWCHAEARRPA